jgi:hypothetical protein
MRSRIIIATVLLLMACGSPPAEKPARAAALPPAQGTSIDKLTAPIALYPDALIAQILLGTSDPAKVKEFDGWLAANNALTGTNLQDAAVKAGFDAPLVALALFPQVVRQMASDLNWTTQLGKAFTANKNAVFDSIQRLRGLAQQMGTLKSSPQQEVKTQTTDAGQQVIIIEPTNPQVVYVPQYNPQVVYTQPATTTVVVQEDDDDAAEAVAAGLIGFTAGIAIGASMDNHYYGPYGWYGGAYMYNDAWDDYYDHREDAREDWMDHREDVIEERGEYARDRQENRTERSATTQENRTQRTEARSQAAASGQTQRAQSGTAAQTQRAQPSTATQSTTRTGNAESRGYSSGTKSTTQQRSGSSDAFSGYSSGKSQRATSSRGQASRSSSARSGGGGGGRRR